MKKMDELDQAVALRGMMWGYRAAMPCLAVWTLFNCWQPLVRQAPYQPLPALIVCLSASVQGFYQLGAKQKMVSGDPEYRAPNRFAQTVAATVVLTAVLLGLGTWLMVRT